MEIYNYKNKDDFKKFKEETEENNELIDIFEDDSADLEIAAEKWLSTLNKIIIKCFKKIRINCNRPNKALENLFTKKEDLKKKIAIATSEDENCEQSKEDLELIGEEIAALCEEQNKEVV